MSGRGAPSGIESLHWGAGAFMDEAGDHLREGLFHLRFLRDLILRTGRGERADEVGWFYGYFGETMGYPWDVYAEQLACLLMILDVDLSGELVDAERVTGVGDDTEQLLTNGVTAGDEDLLVILHGEEALVARYREALKTADRGFTLCSLASAGELAERGQGSQGGTPLSDIFGAENVGPNLVAVVGQAAMDPEAIYDFFWALVEAWEVVRQAPDGS